MRSRRSDRRLVGAALVVSAIVMFSQVASVPAGAATTFVVVQMNLCNSGIAVASCYTSGKAVDEAVGKIGRYPPDLVTLQEVCRDDLYARDGWGKLAKAMADLYGTRDIVVDFVPALDRDTNDAYRCVNGEQFGLAMIHHGDGRDRRHGWYDNQDSSDEIRAWTCATVIKGRLTGCTTHLSIRPDVATRQCRELVSILASPWVMPKVIIAGDLNLTDEADAPHNVHDCTAASLDRRGDNAVQHVLFTRNVESVRGLYEGMRWTDHPLLYQRFRV